MDRPSGPALVLATAILLTALASVPSPAVAQVGTSSLAGSVCAIEQHVVYIRAPDAGDPAGCGSRLAGATLRLTKPGVGGTIVGAVDKTATTDANGSYQFTTLADGAYTLSVSRTGFEAATLNVTVSGASNRDVGLRPQTVVVTGKVVDTSGAPVASARVSACCGMTWGSSDAFTDGAGAFTLKTEAGERTFSVEKDGRGLLMEQRFVDGSQPITLTVPPPPTPDATLRGTVRGQDGKPLPGVVVNVYSDGYGCCYYDQPMPADTAEGSSGSGVASSPAYHTRPYYGGGSNSSTTDSQGRYTMRVFGGSSVSVSVHLDGHAPYNKHLAIAEKEDRQLDIQLLKYPAKTAHIEGKVVDASTGKPLRHVSISIQSPAYGLYECSQEPTTDGGGSAPKPMPAEDDPATSYMVPPHESRCAITIAPDGTFRGDVTPGYAIVRAYHDPYRACQEAAEGGIDKPCMPEYYGWTQSTTLAADGTTTITIAMAKRPAPDAVVSGYLLDAATGKPIAGGQVGFSNEDSYGYGTAVTDENGSYRIRIRSGHLTVTAYAEGHLHWEGTVDAKPGETPLDIQLPQGEEAGGGPCCYAYADKGVMATSAPAMEGGSGSDAMASSSDRSGLDAFEDLNGGLGPYDAAARARALDEASGKASPGAGLFLLVALIGCAAWMRRR